MFKKINIVPRWIIFLIDIVICCVALAFAYLIRYNLSISSINIRDFSGNLLILVLINSIVFLNVRTYAGIIRYTGLQDALRICYAILMTTFVLFIISLVSSNTGGALSFPPATLIIYSLFSFLFLISYRVLVKYVFTYLRSYKMDRKNVIIYGAGEAGFATKRVLEHDSTSNITVVAFVDDDLRKLERWLMAYQIHHTLELQKYIPGTENRRDHYCRFQSRTEKKE
jgi:FlaA1/EpsC-like NDP-sugar epimerase